MWQQLTDAGLASVEWVSDTETVGIVINWKGAFKSIESLPTQAGETGTEYWTVSYQIEEPICLAEACDALLLSAQIVSRRGGNLLTPVGLHNDCLTMKLNILRAGRPPSRPPKVPVPGKVVMRVVDVVARMPFKYAEASKQAEALLLQEIERLEPYVPQVGIVSSFLPDFREMLDQLRLIREGLISDTLYQQFKQANNVLHLMRNPIEASVRDQTIQEEPDLPTLAPPHGPGELAPTDRQPEEVGSSSDSSMRRLFADFFRRRYDLHPQAHAPIDESRVRGWFEEYRVETFRSERFPLLRTGDLWSRLSGKVYDLTHFQLMVILVLYDDDTILWLDDHSDDADFEEFIRRERLPEWLPGQIDELVQLLIETKFSYLGRPQLIRNVSEIPKLTEREKSWQAESKAGLEALQEEEKRLASVTNQIQSPACTSQPDGTFRLGFCIWTKILGKVINIACTFGPDHRFSYEAVLLTEHVGRSFVPR